MKNKLLFLSSVIASCVFSLCNTADAQFQNMPVGRCPMSNQPAQQYQHDGYGYQYDGQSNWQYYPQDQRYMPQDQRYLRQDNRYMPNVYSPDQRADAHNGNNYNNNSNPNNNHDRENWWNRNQDENGKWWNRDENGDRDVNGNWMNNNPNNGNGQSAKPLKMDSVERFSGTVRSVNRVQYPDGTHLQVILQTDQGDLTVMLGPSQFVERSKVKVQSGDKIQVTGYRVGANGSEVIVAQKISKNGNELQLRNDMRQPMWGQPRLNGNTQGPMPQARRPVIQQRMNSAPSTGY